MSLGRSLRLFLVDGTSNGLLTAEIMNWTGHVLTGPRSKLAELVQRPECGRTGVYFLVGPDPENNLRFKVYIGESDDVAKRLKQHNRPEASEGTTGGKDFWEKVCLVTSKDQNLTKTHVKYLESLLISIANQVGRCELLNGTAHDYGNLPESDRADMAFFLEQIRTVLPVLGFDFLRELSKPSAAVSASLVAQVSSSPRFNLEVPRYGISALGQEIDGEFFVLKGSKARVEWVGTERGYQGLFKQLVAEGLLVAQGSDNLVFSDDYAFSSPSAAAAVVCGRSANGRTSWVVEGTGQTYAAWQDQQLNSVTPEPEAE
ncbi:GIY-YIG nuclease family protein [Pseudomonas haemolytica]|uniref:GIY-YIG nuclease family protein n=1 Tax=Pseudomonas haemolytica TaxID=2600065 RepID=A0A646P288_9PSED|nr:GIY-YIG nuclease family protein [Pseudomonas haemolytica]MRJ23107.1 GIY-YIG nuclease family protein [Pseudomonas haemolytica]